jgi:hypothetical protein
MLFMPVELILYFIAGISNFLGTKGVLYI